MRRHSVTKGRAAKGAAAMCIGVGQGIATLWEAC
jgi:acetyl-CoA acetyltransferase